MNSAPEDTAGAARKRARSNGRQIRRCLECSSEFQPTRDDQEFCQSQGKCRAAWYSRVRREAAASARQLGLALVNPIARAADPVTSHIAAAAVTESGSRASHCALVLGVLAAARRPLTYREIHQELPAWSHLEAVEVMRRLNDLRHEEPSLVEQLDRRVCSVSGRPAVTWAVASKATQGEAA